MDESDLLSKSTIKSRVTLGVRLFTALTALGVVFGDIGTSPLYAIRECFHGPNGLKPTPLNVNGVLSLIFWSLILVISIKYLLLVMRADNDGEGGVLALMALVRRSRKKEGNSTWFFVGLGLFGAGLLFGDGVITPAISVLSAVEGLHLITPVFEPFIVPIAIAILFFLFAFQHHGTSQIGGLFGPVMLLWFSVLFLLGLQAIIRFPSILLAVNPLYAVHFFADNHWHGFIILGLVFLVVTGGEALYADMGHFGRKPIRLAWFALVLPSLLTNYFGQGALLMIDPSSKINPFYELCPEHFQIPLVLLATIATVIASQAVITGVFSLCQEAVQLGMLPRMEIIHTSITTRGQIYLPMINWLLFVAVIAVILGFRNSSNLAAAYGIAVTSTMVITTFLMYDVTRKIWKWSLTKTVVILGLLLVVDLMFFFANVTKIASGAWFPLLVGVVSAILMTTWEKGRQNLVRKLQKQMIPIEDTASLFEEQTPTRIPGCAIFLSGHRDWMPVALLKNVKHNKVLHETVLILTVVTDNKPRVADEKKIELQPLGNGIYRVLIHFGFKENPNIEKILPRLKYEDFQLSPERTTFFLGRETLEIGTEKTLPIWQKRLFLWLSKNAADASNHFGLPMRNVIEIGVQVQI